MADHISVAEPFLRARRAVLGAHAVGPPRVLVRVDEFPRTGSFLAGRASSASFAHFDALMAAAHVPYLLAVTPRIARDPLDPRAGEARAMSADEVDLLTSLAGDRVAFAVHGLDHRTRIANPRQRSELDGLSPPELNRRLDEAHAVLAALGIAPRVLVPPFNRFEARQYELLARRYDVICAGPETVNALGLRAGPAWWRGAVLLPSYQPLYGRAADVREGIRRLVDGGVDLWAPIVLHWGWEADDGWGQLERLVDEIAPHVAPWSVFLGDVDRSR